MGFLNERLSTQSQKSSVVQSKKHRSRTSYKWQEQFLVRMLQRADAEVGMLKPLATEVVEPL